MNERDIELVNKVAEMTPDVYNTKYDNGMKCIELTEDALQKFADLIRADEREACAKVCETLELPDWPNKIRTPLAAAIRARGNT